MNLEEILYPENTEKARMVQAYLLKKLKLSPLRSQPVTLAAIDAAFTDRMVLAAICLFTYPELEFLEEQTWMEPVKFPYIPGFLSFREGPAAYRGLLKLSRRPDLLLVDGQGIAHPRRLGLATYMGILLNTPSIGCAKSHLIGDFRMPGRKAGSFSELRDRGDLVGYALRSRNDARPIFVSPGHLISHREALEIVLSCLRGFRVPEPLRRAHQLTQKVKRQLT